MVLTPLGIAWC